MDALPVNYEQLSEDYYRIEQAIAFLDANVQTQPALNDIAAHVGLSEYHFQRIFTRWVGISPKRFLQFLTKERAKQMLEQSRSLLDVAYESGLSGPGRLHDLFVACEAVTPGEYKAHGAGLTIVYGFHPTPFGECLLAQTSRGICGLSFVENGNRDKVLGEMRRRWKNSEMRENSVETRPLVNRIFAPFPYADPQSEAASREKISLFLSGTNFQIKVWEALLRIPSGSVVSYEDLAVHIGMPRAARAVANAVANNPIPVIIPCHRVIRKVGDFGGYRYGTARKKALLVWESAQSES